MWVVAAMVAAVVAQTIAAFSWARSSEKARKEAGRETGSEAFAPRRAATFLATAGAVVAFAAIVYGLAVLSRALFGVSLQMENERPSVALQMFAGVIFAVMQGCLSAYLSVNSERKGASNRCESIRSEKEP